MSGLFMSAMVKEGTDLGTFFFNFLLYSLAVEFSGDHESGSTANWGLEFGELISFLFSRGV